MAAFAILFFGFISFGFIAQAGGDTKNISSALPKAVGIAVITVDGFLFSMYLPMYTIQSPAIFSRDKYYCFLYIAFIFWNHHFEIQLIDVNIL